MSNIIPTSFGGYSLINDDCLNAMGQIPDKSIDLIVCDLPYGATRNKWDSIILFEDLWNQYLRVIKENGCIALFCDGLFMADLMKSNAKMWRYNLIWDKQRGCDFLNANVKPLKSHEEIAIFYKKKPTYNKQLWYSTPYNRGYTIGQSSNYGHRGMAYVESPDGSRNPLTVLSYPRDGKRYHPTQKPVALLEWLIKTYSNENELVLDNCMGSGSTGIACRNTNRRFIGIEIEQRYFDVAKQRIESVKV